MSKGFEDWTMEDVLNHNKRVQKSKKTTGGISLYTSEEKKPKKSKYRNEKTVINRC